MLNSLISFFGFDDVAPKPAPKRPPTARSKPVAKEEPALPGPDLELRAAERRLYQEDQEARAARAIHTVGSAAHIFARHIGQVGERPSALHLVRAQDVLGPRRCAYFQALALTGRKVPLLPLGAVGDEGRETGFGDGIDRDLNADLDLWAGIRELERKLADQARRINKPVAMPIAIPSDILQRLLERDRLRADRVGGAKGTGGVRATPDAAPGPLPVPEPEKGSRGVRGGKGKDGEEEEAAPPPAPEAAAKPVPDDDDEPPGGPGKP